MSINLQVALASIIIVTFAAPLQAGGSAMGTVAMPLDGGEAGVRVLEVPYYEWYAHSNIERGFHMIAKPYVPPTNAPEKLGDMNIASRYGLKIAVEEVSINPSKIEVTLDCTGLDDAKAKDWPVFDATLEALRVQAQSQTRTGIEFAILLRPSGQEALATRFAEFLQHPRDQKFFLE